MSDDREIRPGWLPPKAPVTAPTQVPAQSAVPGRPAFVQAKARSKTDAPTSPLAVTAIVMSSISLALLVVSVGVGWGICSLLSVVSLGLALTARQRLRAGQPGREGQVRTAVLLSVVGLVLAATAAAVWLGLESNGVTPQDLQNWLERQLERRQATR